MSFARTPLSFAIFSILSTSIFAESTIDTSDNTSDQDTITLNTISLKAEKDNNEVGKTVYTQEEIERIPNSSKNITDFLKVNPNVQFSNSFRSGMQQGELKPAEVSINGSLPYDNKFLINGVSINNNINPASTANGHDIQELMGNSQTVAINTDLLCNITVLDSNVSAEYGEFTGGVVSAETCAPNTEIGKIHGSITYDYTSDSWSKINFPDSMEEKNFNESIKESKQPYFTKQGISATAYGKYSEKLAFNSYGSFRDSKIPLKTNINSPAEFDQKRTASNIGLETFYTPSNQTSFKVGIQYLENYGQYFQYDMANSESEHTSNSANISFNLKNKFTNFDLEQQLNLQNQTANRQGASNTYTWTQSSTKNWKLDGTQKEGSFGVMEQQEKKIEYSIKATTNPFQIKQTWHNIKFGAGYGHYEAYWTRPNTVYLYSASAPLLKNTSCLDNNGNTVEACDIGDGTGIDSQFLKSRASYLAGKIDIKQDRIYFYSEDKIQWRDILIGNIGFRSDYDSLTKDLNIAPRSSITFKPLSTNQLYFTSGWNRYYGLNAFYNELQDRKNAMVILETRTTPTNNWDTISFNPTYSYRSQLDTPYSDETMFAINSELSNLKMGLKWVNRQNKDQLKRTTAFKDPKIDNKRTTYTYDNSGQSKSDIFSFTLQNINPLSLKNSVHYLSLNADITNTNRNFENYGDLPHTGPSKIYYDGRVIDAVDKPAENFNTPWTVRIDWNISFKNIPLNINNYFSYRAKTQAMMKTSYLYKGKDHFVYILDGEPLDTYTPYTTKPAFNWDMRATYAIQNSKNTQTILGLTINNVINRKNEYVESGVATPEIGRQFIADITFKF